MRSAMRTATLILLAAMLGATGSLFAAVPERTGEQIVKARRAAHQRPRGVGAAHEERARCRRALGDEGPRQDARARRPRRPERRGTALRRGLPLQSGRPAAEAGAPARRTAQPEESERHRDLS